MPLVRNSSVLVVYAHRTRRYCTYRTRKGPRIRNLLMLIRIHLIKRDRRDSPMGNKQTRTHARVHTIIHACMYIWKCKRILIPFIRGFFFFFLDRVFVHQYLTGIIL